MRKLVLIILALCVLLSAVPVMAETTEQDFSVTSGCNTIEGQMPFLGTQKLVDNGKAMVLYEVGTDTLMYADNADEQLPPASLIKILTALIAVEKGNLDDLVTVKQAVLSTLDSDAAMASPKLVADEVLTLRDLLYCMMVSAANDAAVVLADYVLGDQETFVAEMNRYAKELGCTNTNFVNVHGLHHKDQYTSARDVIRILSKAVQNERFCEIFFADKYVVPATNKNDSRILVSQNYLLNKDIVVIHYDERVKGSRTGTTTDGTTNIASYAEVDDMKLISVVMGSASAYDEKTGRVKVFGGYGETQKLLDLGFTGNKAGQLIYENQVLKQIPISGGSSDVTIASKEARSSVIPADMTLDRLEFRYVNEVPLSLPVQEGQRVSTLQIWCNNICIAQTDIFAMSSVVAADQVYTADEKVSVDISGILSVLFKILAGMLIVGLLIVVVFYLRRVNKIAKQNKQRRRNRRYRRRSR